MNISSSRADTLETLLDQMMYVTLPILENSNQLIVQENSPLLTLPDKLLEQIVTHVPLKDRVKSIARVCKKLQTCVKMSIKSVELYKEELDSLEENKLRYFFNLYGQNITRMNFDLFRSIYTAQCTQWSWRQSLISCITLCPNLEELTVLICNRHRLRDKDLVKIFNIATHLKTVNIDAQFITGHCLKAAPRSLEKLELEICSRFSLQSLNYLFSLKHLKALSLSQLVCISDTVVNDIVCNLKKLEELALIFHNVHMTGLTADGLSSVTKLQYLNFLALEGIEAVTDEFLINISTQSSLLRNNLATLSIAFCANFSNVGLASLSELGQLKNLNLEGCSNRDISHGLECIASKGRLIRILLSENCRISCDSLIRIIERAPHLCLVDITANIYLNNLQFATSLALCSLKHRNTRLNFLTDQHSPWNIIPKPVYDFPLEVIHVSPMSIPLLEFFSNTLLSMKSPNQLCQGTFSAKLRKGNRCRLLCNAFSFSDEKENSPRDSFSPIEDNFLMQTSVLPLTMISDIVDNMMPNLIERDESRPSNNNKTSFFKPCNLDDVQSKFNLYPANFWINKKKVAESDHFELRSGGAPRPPILPIEVPEQPKIHYTRGPRSKRRSFNIKTNTAIDQNFTLTLSDFPPLGSS